MATWNETVGMFHSGGTGTLAGKFGVTGTPETFFIDRRGRVIPPHIVANTGRADLDAGIQRALKA